MAGEGMKITVVSTEKIVHVNGVKARLWEGETESGIPVHCFIPLIAPTIPPLDARQKEFLAELKQTKAPSAEMETYPARLVL
jgi:hypothetical protein